MSGWCPDNLSRIVRSAVKSLDEMDEPAIFIEAEGYVLFIEAEGDLGFGPIIVQCAPKASVAGRLIVARAQEPRVVRQKTGTVNAAPPDQVATFTSSHL